MTEINVSSILLMSKVHLYLYLEMEKKEYTPIKTEYPTLPTTNCAHCAIYQ